jgi:hypothetical protein
MKRDLLIVFTASFCQVMCMEKDVEQKKDNLPLIIRYPNPLHLSLSTDHIDPKNIPVIPEHILNQARERRNQAAPTGRLEMHYPFQQRERLRQRQPRQNQRLEHHRLVRCGKTTYDCCPNTYVGEWCLKRFIVGCAFEITSVLLMEAALSDCDQGCCLSCCLKSSAGTTSLCSCLLSLSCLVPCITDDGTNVQCCIKHYNGPQRDNNNNEQN